MRQAAALPDVVRDFERVSSDVVAQAAQFASSILADVAGRRGALSPRIALSRQAGFVLSPHIGGVTADAYVKMGVAAAQNALAVLRR